MQPSSARDMLSKSGDQSPKSDAAPATAEDGEKEKQGEEVRDTPLFQP